MSLFYAAADCKPLTHWNVFIKKGEIVSILTILKDLMKSCKT